MRTGPATIATEYLLVAGDHFEIMLRIAVPGVRQIDTTETLAALYEHIQAFFAEHR